MSFHQKPYLDCEWPGCFSTTFDVIPQMHLSAAELRKLVAAREDLRWVHRSGFDFCGHHPLAEHMPKVDKVWDGYRSSCSCGWHDTEKWSSVERSHTLKSWLRHLPREEWKDCPGAVLPSPTSPPPEGHQNTP